MEHPSLIEQLTKQAGTDRVYRVVDRYVLFVRGHEYQVEILDMGAPYAYRYTVRVRDLTAGTETFEGNGGSTPAEALDAVQRHVLRPPEGDVVVA